MNYDSFICAVNLMYASCAMYQWNIMTCGTLAGLEILVLNVHQVN